MPLSRLLRAAFAPSSRVTRPIRRLRLESLEARDCPSGGQLDTTFNGTGVRPLPNATMRIAYDSVVQPDGKILTVGMTGNSGAGRATLARMNADGSLDTTFNGTGQLVLPQTVGGVTITSCDSAALQPDGKILVGLYAYKTSAFSSDKYFAVARLNANGSVDTSFGTNSGYWLANPQSGSSSVENVAEVALLSDGSIIAGGGAKASDGYVGFAAVKLTPSGQINTAFGSGGMTVVHVGTTHNSPSLGSMGLVVTPAGGVVLSGYAGPSSSPRGCLVVLTPGGQRDTGFDGDGVLIGADLGLATVFTRVAMQGDHIVVAGHFKQASNISVRGLAARYSLSGQLDTTFGAGGYYLTPADPATNSSRAGLVVAPDGSIALSFSNNTKDTGGVTHYGFYVIHLFADGMADASFGSAGNGIVTVYDAGVTNVLGCGLAIGPDGKLLVTFSASAGTLANPVYYRFTGW